MMYFFLQLAQPIRLLLNYVGEEYEEIQFVMGDGRFYTSISFSQKLTTFYLFDFLLTNVHDKQLRSCRDGQFF